VAPHLLVEDEELKTKGRGFGVDAVGAPHNGRPPVFEGTAAQGRNHSLHAALKQPARVPELQGEGCVEHVTRGHPVVNPARLRTHVFGDVG